MPRSADRENGSGGRTRTYDQAVNSRLVANGDRAPNQSPGQSRALDLVVAKPAAAALNDIAGHVLTPTCWRQPRVERQPLGGLLVVHKAAQA